MDTSKGAAPSGRNALTAIIVACVLWGLAMPLGKIALRELPVAQMVLGRFLLALLALLPVAFYYRVRVRAKDLPLFLVSGILMVPAMFLLQFEGLARTTVTNASLIIGAIPPLLALAAWVVDRERLSLKGWGALIGSALGVGLMVGTPVAGYSIVGDLLVFASAIVAVLWVLVMRRLLRRYPPLAATTYTMAIGTAVLAPIALWMDGVPPLALRPETWWALVGLGVACTSVTYSLWNWGLRYVESSRAGAFVNLEPLIGGLAGVFLFGDVLGPGTLAGGVLILTSAVVISTEYRAERRSSRPMPPTSDQPSDTGEALGGPLDASERQVAPVA